MRAVKTWPLAGVDEYTPAKVWKIRGGERYITASGKTAPRKLWHWEICEHWQREEKTGWLPVHKETQQALVRAVGSDKPEKVPCYVLSNDPHDIVSPWRSAYWGPRQWCACHEFRHKLAVECEADGIPWRDSWPRSPEEADAAGIEWPPKSGGNEAYVIGTAKRNDLLGPGKKFPKLLCPSGELICNPATCPINTGEHGIGQYGGKALCRPHAIVRVKLDFDPVAGEPAYVSTTGWNSIKTLITTLQECWMEAGQWLPNVPLYIVYGRDRVVPKGMSEPQWIPVFRFEPRQSPKESRQIAKQIRADFQQIARPVAQVPKALPESRAYQDVVALEHFPDTEAAEPAWKEIARGMMAQLQYSDGRAAAVIDKNEGDPEGLLANLEAEIAAKATPADEEPIDVEATEVETHTDDDGRAPTAKMILEYRDTHQIPLDIARETANKIRAKFHHDEESGLRVAKFSDEARTALLAELQRFVAEVDSPQDSAE
jgi:hypothetical protein